MAEKVLMLVNGAPYGSVYAVEALRAGIAFAGMDLKTRLVMKGDGVFCLCEGQKPEKFGMTGISEAFANAEEFGLEMYAHAPSLKERGLDKPSDPVKMTDDAEIKKMIGEADVILNF